MKPALFLDRDGVINEECGHLHDPAAMVMIAGVPDAIATVNRMGVPIVVVTNQADIGRGLYGVEDYRRVNRAIEGALRAASAHIDGWYFCPHRPDGACTCRKPQPGMLLAAGRELGIDLRESILVGDTRSDLLAGHAVGCRTILVRTGHGRAAEAKLLGTEPSALGALADYIADSFPAALPWIEHTLSSATG